MNDVTYFTRSVFKVCVGKLRTCPFKIVRAVQLVILCFVSQISQMHKSYQRVMSLCWKGEDFFSLIPHIFHFNSSNTITSIQVFLYLCWNDQVWHTVKTKAAVLATNLTDGAHGSHVAFISWAVLGWGQQRFGVEEGFGVQGIQASIDWNLTHRTQVTVAPDLQFGGMLRWNPDTETTEIQCYTHSVHWVYHPCYMGNHKIQPHAHGGSGMQLLNFFKHEDNGLSTTAASEPATISAVVNLWHAINSD